MKEIDEKAIRFATKHSNIVRQLEHKMVIKTYKIPTHPSQMLKDLENNIKAYNVLKKICYKDKYGKIYFQQMHQDIMSNYSEHDDWLNVLNKEIERIEKNYDKLVAKYERDLKQYKMTMDNAPELPKKIVNDMPIRVHSRVNIYANETNTYISPLGQNCIDFEESIIENAELYKKGICPICGEKVEMPKMKKSCPHCKQKIYVREGGIGQGKFVMTEFQYLRLKELKDEFYADRDYNPNYGTGVYIEPMNNMIETTPNKEKHGLLSKLFKKAK